MLYTPLIPVAIYGAFDIVILIEKYFLQCKFLLFLLFAFFFICFVDNFTKTFGTKKRITNDNEHYFNINNPNLISNLG